MTGRLWTATIDPPAEALRPRLAAGGPPIGLFAPGAVVGGRFRIERQLGQGGMGQVFAARDLELGVVVALKVIRPELATNTAAIRRFKREVHLARQVTHPNVCRIFDLFQHQACDDRGPSGVPLLFLTMELLEGETLADRLAREGPMAPEEALPLVRDMAAALDAAHRAGIVHRDFKSSNVMLVPAGEQVRGIVTDFGMAKVQQEVGSHRGGLGYASHSGGGTPAYMAPEVLLGEKATAAADIFALGVVIFEMTTGARPFVHQSPQLAVHERLAGASPSPRVHSPRLDATWERTIRRCLDRDPERRFGRAGDTVAALAARGSGGRRFWLVAAALALTLGALGSWAYRAAGPVAPSVASLAATGRPSDPDAARLYARGLHRLRQRDFRGAISLLEVAARSDAGSPYVHSALASCWKNLGYDARAEAEARRALELSGGLEPKERLLIEGSHAEAARDWHRAREIFASLWRAFPDEIDYGLRLAAAEAAGGDPAQALATVEELRWRFGTDPRVDLAEAEAAALRSELERQRSAAARAAETGAALDADTLVARARLLEAEALHDLGRRDEANVRMAEIREHYEASGDLRSIAEALVNRRDIIWPEYVGLEMGFEEALEIFREVGDRRGIARVLVRLARLDIQEDRLGPARERIDEAKAVAEELGNPSVLAEVLNVEAVWFFFQPERGPVLETFGRAVEQARRGGDLLLLSGILSNYVGELGGALRLNEALAAAEEATSLSREVGSRYVFGLNLVKSAGIYQATGRLDLAEERCREALDLGRRTDLGNIASQALDCLGNVEAHRGSLEAARAHFEESKRILRQAHPGHHADGAVIGLARTLARHGRLAEAEALFRHIMTWYPDNPRWPRSFEAELAEIALEKGRLGEARELFASALSDGGATRIGGARRLEILRIGARIDAASGRGAEALATLRSIVDEASAAGAVIHALGARLELGRVLIATGDELAGRRELEALAREARRLGFALLVERAAAALRRGEPSAQNRDEVRTTSASFQASR